MHRCNMLGRHVPIQLTIMRASSDGIPSHAHISKPQFLCLRSQLRYGKVSIKLDPDYFIIMQKHMQDLCWELGLAFASSQLSTQVSILTSKNCCCHVDIHVTLETWNSLWSGKSQLPCSQWPRLHGLTSSDLGLGTREPCEPASAQEVFGHSRSRS